MHFTMRPIFLQRKRSPNFQGGTVQSARMYIDESLDSLKIKRAALKQAISALLRLQLSYQREGAVSRLRKRSTSEKKQ